MNQKTGPSVLETGPSVLLAIGGLDPTGAAGILLDAAAARSVGAHSAAICAVTTVQNSERFVHSRPEDPQIVIGSIEAVFSALPVGAIKTGALGNKKIVVGISQFAAEQPTVPLIVDPVVRSSSGGILLDDSGVAALRDHLMPQATLITPNVPEAEILTGESITNIDEMVRGTHTLLSMGANSVLIKGGHLEGQIVHDVFADCQGREQVFSGARIGSSNVRGTGCALASLVGGLIAKGEEILSAIISARALLQTAMNSCQVLGEGDPILVFAPQSSG